MRSRTLSFATLILMLSACSSGNSATPSTKAEIGELTENPCDSNADCSDGAFCNGEETCDEGFCRLGVSPNCDDGIECTIDSCSHAQNGCVFSAPDLDGDGHADATCEGPNGELLGDDCDDSDADRFPGNTERCTPDELDHDEDCDPLTFGHLDLDLDGYSSSECCNQGADELSCGPDCDDSDYSRYPDHPEICDQIDNDCDGEVDVNTSEVPWYPDADGDHFGTSVTDPVISCEPIMGHSLRDSDCDDATGAIHSAAVEVCDGADNDCDGDVDEDGVCACAPEGNVRACACAAGVSGTQSCSGGLWNQCDCSECVTGSVDCLGDLLPRECVAGRWVVLQACRGVQPICLAGECVCADGTQDCASGPDLVPPVLIASIPLSNSLSDSSELKVVAGVFSEDIVLPASGAPVVLTDARGQTIPGAAAVSGSTLIFTPTEPLGGGMTYSLQFSGAITDRAGNTLGPVQAISFRTATSPVLSPLSTDLDLGYSDPRLDVSPGGEAILLASEFSGYLSGGAPVSEGVISFHFNGDSYQRRAQAMEAGELRALTADDQGNAFALRGFASDHSIVSYNGTDWSTPAQVFAEWNRSGGVYSTGAGLVASLVANTSQLRIDVRDTNGTWRTPHLTIEGSISNPYELQADLGSGGHMAITWIESGGLGLIRSGADVSSWSLAGTAVPPALGNVNGSSVIVDDNGTAYVAYTQDRSTPAGISTQLFVSEIPDQSGWPGRGHWVTEEQAGSAQLPRIGVDSHGDLTVTYLLTPSLLYADRRVDGVWSEPELLSVDARSITSQSSRVAPNGVVKVVWIQLDGSTYNLWGATLAPQSGWKVEMLIEPGEYGNITSPTMDIDDNGVAYVAVQTGSQGLQTFRF